MNESTFSLAQIWAQGDGVSHAVAIMLALMSLASWSVIFVKAWSLVQLRRMSGGAKQFWHATSFEAGMAALAPAGDNPFRDLAQRDVDEHGLSAGEKRMLTRARSILTSEIALSEDLDEAEIQRLLDVNLGFSEPKPGDEKHHSEAPAEPADRTLARIESDLRGLESSSTPRPVSGGGAYVPPKTGGTSL